MFPLDSVCRLAFSVGQDGEWGWREWLVGSLARWLVCFMRSTAAGRQIHLTSSYWIIIICQLNSSDNEPNEPQHPVPDRCTGAPLVEIHPFWDQCSRCFYSRHVLASPKSSKPSASIIPPTSSSAHTDLPQRPSCPHLPTSIL